MENGKRKAKRRKKWIEREDTEGKTVRGEGCEREEKEEERKPERMKGRKYGKGLGKRKRGR